MGGSKAHAGFALMGLGDSTRQWLGDDVALPAGPNAPVSLAPELAWGLPPVVPVPPDPTVRVL